MTMKIDFYRIADYMEGSDTIVRFAPSPTGWLHIGGIRTALINALFAKSVGGEFMLRIEDTDRERFVEGAVDMILETLNWFGIVPDNSEYVVYQSKRLSAYKYAANILLGNGSAYRDHLSKEENVIIRNGLADNASHEEQKVYADFVKTVSKEWANGYISEAEIDKIFRAGLPYGRFYRPWAANDFVELPPPPDWLDRPVVVRFAAPITGRTSWNDNGKTISIPNSQISDAILLKSDGYPTYHLANVVDDYDMRVTHVIRGEEWISSTPLHIQLYKAFDRPLPKFIHLPLIMNPTGKGKLSKRHSQSYVKGEQVLVTGQQYIDSGYSPEAIKNWLLAATGIRYNGDEYFTMDQITETFSLRDLSHTPTRLPFSKLASTNRWHIRNMADNKFKQLDPELNALFSRHRIGPVKQSFLIPFLKSRTTKNGDWDKYMGFINGAPHMERGRIPIDDQELAYNICQAFAHSIQGGVVYDDDLDAICQTYSVKRGTVLGTVRAVIGGRVSPPVDVLLKLLGKGEINNRIAFYFNR